jgi:hypothetical protein
VGILLWIASARLTGAAPEAVEPLDLSGSGRRAAASVAALGSAAIAWRYTSAGAFETAGVCAWAAALFLWIFAWWPSRGSVAPAPTRSEHRRRRLVVGAMLAILAVGGAFRFYRLAETPGDPNSDHVEDLLNLVELDGGARPIFFPSNTGQAPLPFYFTFLLHRLGLPLHYQTLKISTALIGMLAIPATYLLGRELGGSSLGLLAAALLAWDKWTTLGARRGLTFAWAVFPTALFLAALLRFMRRGDRASALGAGIWLGLGQYGYNAFKIVPVMVPVAFGFLLFDRRWRGRRARLVADGLLIGATALLLFLPLLHYMVQHADLFWYRALTRAGSRERPLPGPALAIFAGNLKNMALAFHWRGDGAWINTVSGEPFLDPATGGLLFAGLVLAIARAVRGSARWAVAVLSLFFLTLASTLALAFPIENPGINRAAVAAPSVFVLAALPAAWLAALAARRGGWLRPATAALLAATFAFSIWQNAESYFVRFDRQNHILLDPVMAVVDVIRAERARGVPMGNMYLLSTANWIDARNLGFELDDSKWAQAHNVPIGAAIPERIERPLVFLFHPSDQASIQGLKRTYPSGAARIYPQSNPDRNFGAYFVER